MSRVRHALRVTLVSAALLVTCALTTAFAAEPPATTTDSLRLRAEPSTEASILATAPKGVSVSVLEETGDGWYKVEYIGKTGYMSADYLIVTEAKEYVRSTDVLNIRAAAGTEYDKVGQMPRSAVADLLDDSVDGWYKVDYNGTVGYVSADYAEITTQNTSGLGQQIVAYALQFEGYPYVYGAAGPTKFDCSGLTKYVYAQFGYTLNRSASDQYYNGVSISKSELQPGDLVLFNSGNASKNATHVGIYIGGGQFIHASTSSTGVIISDLNSNYYTGVYVGARRII